MRTAAISIFVAVNLCSAADFSGDWVAEVSARGVESQYARVHIGITGATLAGTWNQSQLEGSASGEHVSLMLTRSGSRIAILTGAASGNSLLGEGQMMTGGRGGGGQMEKVAWKLTRPAQRPAGAPRTIAFEPKEFHGYYAASIPPALHIFPGDTVSTRTYDGSGRDADKRTPGGNLENGPFYVEGALPGDTLVVKLNKVRLDRDSARQGSRINGRAVTPAYQASADYEATFDGEYKLDRAKGVATLAHPTARLKNFSVPILPMIGCIATAPPGEQSYRGTDLGPFGGNMDYNQMGEGVTLYLPVYHPGALLAMGDAHAAMGDGELTGSALETSVSVEFTVDIIPGIVSAGPRLENADYLMAMGIAGSVADSIQVATTQLAEWLKKDYKLSDSEVALVLGAVAKYDITELVDPQFNVVAKVPKSALKTLQ